jgi:acyl carrier protein
MILRLLSEIEKTLNVTIDTDFVQPDDFDTVELAVQTVERTVFSE